MTNLQRKGNASKEIDKAKNNTFQETDMTTDICSSFPKVVIIVGPFITRYVQH